MVPWISDVFHLPCRIERSWSIDKFIDLVKSNTLRHEWHESTMWGPPNVKSWFVNPSNYSYYICLRKTMVNLELGEPTLRCRVLRAPHCSNQPWSFLSNLPSGERLHCYRTSPLSTSKATKKCKFSTISILYHLLFFPFCFPIIFPNLLHFMAPFKRRPQRPPSPAMKKNNSGQWEIFRIQ